jgi:chemotaxis protein MotB
MAKDAGSRPIIIKKVRKAAHAHHGGSWKVAYADFVTAMMAFFMVLWIVGMDEKTRQSIEGYFSNPAGYKKGYGSGVSPISSGNSPARIATNQLKMIVHTAEQKSFAEAAERIRAKLDSARGALGTARFEVAVGDDGLRIELLESGSGDTFFERGSASMQPAARLGLTLIAQELVALRNRIVVEGHTDAATYGANASYTNWELSADRANAARRVLEGAGIVESRVSEVRGYADTKPRVVENPMAAENRRISVLLPFSQLRTVADSVARGSEE